MHQRFRSLDEGRWKGAGELIEVTPFIRRLVEDWAQNIDFTSFEISAVKRKDLPPCRNDVYEDVFKPFPNFTLTIEVRLVVREHPKPVVARLRFRKGFEDINFFFCAEESSIFPEI